MVSETDNLPTVGLSGGTSTAGLHLDESPGKATLHFSPEPRREGIRLRTRPPSTAAFLLKSSGFTELKADVPEDSTRDGNSQSREA